MLVINDLHFLGNNGLSVLVTSVTRASFVFMPGLLIVHMAQICYGSKYVCLHMRRTAVDVFKLFLQTIIRESGLVYYISLSMIISVLPLPFLVQY